MSGPAGDDIERAHLRDPADRTFTIDRPEPPAHLRDLIRRYWFPVWDVPPGRESTQRVLMYPICLLVITPEYARFYGVVRGLSQTTLIGRGYAVGVMFQPAAGFLIAGEPVIRWTDRFADIEELPRFADRDLARRVRSHLDPDPYDRNARRRAYAVVEDAIGEVLPVDDEGVLVNRIVEIVETTTELLRVDDLCGRLGIGERALQRLTARRLGLTPKWLIRRRRLHEAAGRLREGEVDLTALAYDLGYADQAHFSRDWRRSTGQTPREFAAAHRPEPGPRQPR